MEFFLMIFVTFILRFSRAEEKLGVWNIHQPIQNLTGETFSLGYTAKANLSHCSFDTPDNITINIIPETKNLNTTGKRPPQWTWNRYGMDNPTDCGIQINRATLNDSGSWRLTAAPKNEPLVIENINVIIYKLVAPDRIILKPTSVQIDIKPDTDPAPINIKCTAYKTIGNVTFTWLIGENPLTGKVIENYHREISPEQSLPFMYVTEVFQYVPESSHDNQKLTCVANHSMYTKDDLANKINIAAIVVRVTAPPVPQENIVFKNHDLGNQSIEIKFHANPPPTNIYWEMHDMHHQIGEKETLGRYASLGFKPAENGDYIATIHITNLSETDGARDLQNKLWVENEIDKTSYTFTFDFEDQVKVAGLSVGAIVGIVLGCLGAVCLIWLVVSQLRKKRKSKKITQEEIAETRDEMRETSRTQHQDD